MTDFEFAQQDALIKKLHIMDQALREIAFHVPTFTEWNGVKVVTLDEVIRLKLIAVKAREETAIMIGEKK